MQMNDLTFFSDRSMYDAMATNFVAKLAKFAYPNFILSTAVSGRIGRSQRGCKKVKLP